MGGNSAGKYRVLDHVKRCLRVILPRPPRTRMADADLYSCFTWTFVLIVSFGIRIASIINTISTFIKFFSLTLIVILLLCFANYDLLHFDFWGKASHLGPIPHQINSTILTTLFFFMGIEEAIVVAAHAQKSFDVEKAIVIGYLICLFLNVMVCVLSFSFYPQPEMAHLNNPALAQIVGKDVGNWARIFVNITVIIAVVGAWLVATIITT